MKLKDIFEAAAQVNPKKIPKEETSVTMDMPLFIRALEFAREDAVGDVDLHIFAENAEELMKKYDLLGMRNYKRLIKGAKIKKKDMKKD